MSNVKHATNRFLPRAQPPTTTNGIAVADRIVVAGPTLITPVAGASETVYPVDTVTIGGASAITLPLISAAGVKLTVKDATGDADTGNITVSPTGADTIDTGASEIIATRFGSRTFISEASGNWMVT